MNNILNIKTPAESVAQPTPAAMEAAVRLLELPASPAASTGG